jgi:hypothetical protein
MRKNILFVGGSLNQTTMMHQIALKMPEHNCLFTPFFDDGIIGDFSEMGWLDFTILGGRHRMNSIAYMKEQNLPIDYAGQSRAYDLVVTCTDLVVPHAVRGKKVVLVQEGMLEPENLAYHLVRWLGLPRYLANTATTGLSHEYDLFCVASSGYRDLFIQKGVHPDRIVVTGIPNFDHIHQYAENDFPYHHYVLAATSSNREVFKWDNREAFIRKVNRLADGRTVIFKLHPNENAERARKEIETFSPGALVFENGNIQHMIANCDVLVTQTSSVTFYGLALNKEVHSDLDLDHLRRVMPIQNGGTSALKIADFCRQVLNRSTKSTMPVKKPWLAISSPDRM